MKIYETLAMMVCVLANSIYTNTLVHLLMTNCVNIVNREKIKAFQTFHQQRRTSSSNGINRPIEELGHLTAEYISEEICFYCRDTPCARFEV